MASQNQLSSIPGGNPTLPKPVTQGPGYASGAGWLWSQIGPFTVRIIKILIGGVLIIGALLVTFLPDAAAIAVTAAGAPELAPAVESAARGKPVRGIRQAQRIQTQAAAQTAGRRREEKREEVRVERAKASDELVRTERFTGTTAPAELYERAGLGKRRVEGRVYIQPKDLKERLNPTTPPPPAEPVRRVVTPLTVEEQTRRANEQRQARQGGARRGLFGLFHARENERTRSINELMANSPGMTRAQANRLYEESPAVARPRGQGQTGAAEPTREGLRQMFQPQPIQPGLEKVVPLRPQPRTMRPGQLTGPLTPEQRADQRTNLIAQAKQFEADARDAMANAEKFTGLGLSKDAAKARARATRYQNRAKLARTQARELR